MSSSVEQAVLDAAAIAHQDDSSTTARPRPCCDISIGKAAGTTCGTENTWEAREILCFPATWEAVVPASMMAHRSLHLLLEMSTVRIEVPEMDVEATLSAVPSWISDQNTARTSAVCMGCRHHPVVVAHVATVDSFHADGILSASNDHVTHHSTVTAVVAPGREPPVRYGLLSLI